MPGRGVLVPTHPAWADSLTTGFILCSTLLAVELIIPSPIYLSSTSFLVYTNLTPIKILYWFTAQASDFPTSVEGTSTLHSPCPFPDKVDRQKRQRKWGTFLLEKFLNPENKNKNLEANSKGSCNEGWIIGQHMPKALGLWAWLWRDPAADSPQNLGMIWLEMFLLSTVLNLNRYVPQENEIKGVTRRK